MAPGDVVGLWAAIVIERSDVPGKGSSRHWRCCRGVAGGWCAWVSVDHIYFRQKMGSLAQVPELQEFPPLSFSDSADAARRLPSSSLRGGGIANATPKDLNWRPSNLGSAAHVLLGRIRFFDCANLWRSIAGVRVRDAGNERSITLAQSHELLSIPPSIL